MYSGTRHNDPPPSLQTAFTRIFLPAMWQWEELPSFLYIPSYRKDGSFLSQIKKKRKIENVLFFSFLIYVTWLPGKLLFYMSMNMTKINDGFRRINTWRDDKVFLKMSYHHFLDVLLGRFVSRRSRLGVLEADGVVQIISGVVGLSVVVRIRVEGHFLLNGSRRWLLHWFLFLLYNWWWWW